MLVLTLLLALSGPSSMTDVCALLGDADVQAAVGERVTARTAAPNQCQFTTSGTHAVSLVMTESGRQYWDQQFHADRKHPARKIDGLGDEAYWTGGAMAGALYALAGDSFIRVSVGGYRTDAERIEKSKALAELVLKRLSRTSSRGDRRDRGEL